MHSVETNFYSGETGKLTIYACMACGEKLLSSEKYTMSEYALNDYSWQMNLTVNFLEKKDFGEYVCSSVNALGKADGIVRLQGEFDSSGNDDDLSTTQIMGGSTLYENHRTERPLIPPSLPPPWQSQLTSPALAPDFLIASTTSSTVSISSLLITLIHSKEISMWKDQSSRKDSACDQESRGKSRQVAVSDL
ncbi:hypothetical protein WN51_08225 [Melipona quadrifasciata]|uniref:Uncharacterized protein n=1 Tax=Melipona quadrifasciata TaxID=166423 RepID=A0A0M8ZR96_9HYME|nr:hypothetical protein WN51_08225 [Melipona quadrifasciata]